MMKAIRFVLTLLAIALILCILTAHETSAASPATKTPDVDATIYADEYQPGNPGCAATTVGLAGISVVAGVLWQRKV